MDQQRIYQRIGEFVVTFQWLENVLRQIGWLILDPARSNWPPTAFRGDTLVVLFERVEKLFLEALPRCRLGPELETEFRESFAAHARRFHELRRARNKILHSAYIELKAAGEVLALMRSDPKLTLDAETGAPLFDQEILSEESFAQELKELGEVGLFFSRCYLQLIHRLPTDSK